MRYLYIYIFFCFLPVEMLAQGNLSGVVLDNNQQPLVGVSINNLSNRLESKSNALGYFDIAYKTEGDTIQFSSLGYAIHKTTVRTIKNNDGRIIMIVGTKLLDEVVINTGYFKLPLSRSSGSFDYLSEKEINRSMGGNILSRIEDMTTGLQFDRSKGAKEGAEKLDLRIRGLGTIKSESSPLIVLDNFPYLGNIDEINPDDIESVTILKDAAATSIWGAQAGNGVIVLTSKMGKIDAKRKISGNANLLIRNKPDLFYDQNVISNTDLMDVQENLFAQNYYREREDILIPPYVELLFKRKAGKITEDKFRDWADYYRDNDFRKEAAAHLYQRSIEQIYNFGIAEGSRNFGYRVSANYKQDISHIIGNRDKSINLNTSANSMLPLGIGLDYNMNYWRGMSNRNGFSLSDLTPTAFQLPNYSSFHDMNGDFSSFPKNYRLSYLEGVADLGLLDWGFYPLAERELQDNRIVGDNFRLNIGIKKSILKNLSAQLRYGFQRNLTTTSSLYDAESWYARDIVNKFTQANGTLLVPYGGVYSAGNRIESNHTARAQLDYFKTFGVSKLNLLAGAEIREDRMNSEPSFVLYGYDNDLKSGTSMLDYSKFHPIRPRGSAKISTPVRTGGQIIERFISYFGNVGYQWNERLVFNGSIRWDASNIFGVETNQKGVPLWAIGSKVTVINASDIQNKWVDQWNLRLSYGSNGNMNRQVSAMPIYTNSTSLTTQLPAGILKSVGNPYLRWERLNTLNVGNDVDFFSNTIGLKLDLYYKKGVDLIGESYFDPTTGISALNGYYEIDNKVNYANITTKGMDLDIQSRQLIGNFGWTTHVLVSYASNTVSKYLTNPPSNIFTYFNTSGIPVLEGVSRDAIYSIPWTGLSPDNGQPYTPSLDQDYNNYFQLLKVEDLIREGVTVAPWYGSMINTFRLKKCLEISFKINWKAGYVFRRNSIQYNTLISRGIGHVDYESRWRQIGDEKQTNVPAFDYTTNVNRDNIYTYANILFEKGDHIRLQDIKLSYFPNLKTKHINRIQLDLMASNIGLLWKATRYKVDPAIPYRSYPTPFHLSMGLKFEL